MAIEVKATRNDTDREVAVFVELGSDMNDAVARFGEAVVFSNFVAQTKIRAQAIIRDLMKDGKTDAEIQEFMNSWKPGVSRDRVVDPTAAFMNKFATMSKEDQIKFLEELTQKAQG